MCWCTHTDRVLAIRAICDEVNAGLMTGHGAHAFNQTYQPPGHHPVKYLSSAATFVEKIKGKTWKKWFLERNPTLEEETVKVASFPNFDKKLRLKTTSRSSLGMGGGRQKEGPGWPCHTWKGELEEKRKERLWKRKWFLSQNLGWTYVRQVNRRIEENATQLRQIWKGMPLNSSSQNSSNFGLLLRDVKFRVKMRPRDFVAEGSHEFVRTLGDSGDV